MDWTFLYRHFCMKIDRIFKNCSCFIDYRLLMLYRIRRNFCAWQETILHNMTTLSESKSVQKCYINDWPFLYRHFCMKIDRIFNNCSCFIDYRLFMIFLPLTRGRIALQKNVDRIKIGLKTVGVIHERPFFHRLFSMKIDGIFKNCSCFIDYRLLMLYRIRRIFCI